MEYSHKSVLLNETIQSLLPKDNGIYVDGTLGGGGHASELLRRCPTSHIIGIDRDEIALQYCQQHLKGNIEYIHDNFSKIKNILEDRKIDGAILDLGVSSHQFDEAQRGFSYRFDTKLDMRMDREQELTAETIVNTYDFEDLCKIFWNYGEEKYAKSIAKNIINNRPVNTTGQLVEIIHNSLPKKYLYTTKKPEKKVFQALRIAVNDELDILHQAVLDFAECLKPNARLAIITFHSLEDRIVKNAYKELVGSCKCPREVPYCVCGYKQEYNIVTKKPIIAEEKELKENSRAKSAKLRVLERL